MKIGDEEFNIEIKYMCNLQTCIKKEVVLHTSFLFLVQNLKNKHIYIS